jgi:glycerate-2-kinase
MPIIKNFKDLATNKERKILLEIVKAGLKALDYQKVLKNLDLSRELKKYQNIYLIGFGKGSAKAVDILRKKIKFKEIYVIDVTGNYTRGTHPLPSEKNFKFTQKVVERFNSKLTQKDLVIVIVCGGGSAMFTYPVVGIEKFKEINQQLLKSGANIYEMNIVRKHLDLVKGGGLAKILYPAKVISLIFSDVPGNDLSFIASGPTVKDKTTTNDALRIIKKYKIKGISRRDLIETPKENRYFKNVENKLALSNLTALDAMKEKAKKFNLRAKILTNKLEGEVSQVAKYLLNKIKKSREELILCGGETTVKVKGNGKGGRNQELVLWFLKHLKENAKIRENDIQNNAKINSQNNFALFGFNSGRYLSNVNSRNNNHRSSVLNFIIISINSDGWDNSEFAGALGDYLTLEKAKKLNSDLDTFLQNNDSFNFFKKTKDGIKTNRLPINVADLMIIKRY